MLRQARRRAVPWVIGQGHTQILGPRRTRFAAGTKPWSATDGAEPHRVSYPEPPRIVGTDVLARRAKHPESNRVVSKSGISARPYRP
ncbi:hypothetical protein [Nocardioides acrostichi]|uniref:Uncharacterized protein n=1 Tax=Nocardioides acrostichi TaxID=2784339 RepID=A0A930UT38_9ACTN|nr:hypothetical protein [Nocardioides acrostichi]MBF4160348.1 hypothetical protein [Nocardioides acrostichi]